MARSTHLQPGHREIQSYYATLKTFSAQHVEHEGALETAFSHLLAETAKPHGWLLIPKLSMKVGGKSIAPDGTLRDDFNLKHGYWEAKDTRDDLAVEIAKKIKKGYPLSNTIFEDTRQAVLFQNGQEVNRFDLTQPQALADLLNEFFASTEPDIEGFEQAVQEFKERVPELANSSVVVRFVAVRRTESPQPTATPWVGGNAWGTRRHRHRSLKGCHTDRRHATISIARSRPPRIQHQEPRSPHSPRPV